jgi:hypothetical protein
LEQYKRDNAKKHGIRSIGIFGSQATGLASDASDVDVVAQRNILIHTPWFTSKRSLKLCSTGRLILSAAEKA